jgi:hypothetical protein
MMGKKKLAEIRADIDEQFAKSGQDAETWLAERIRSLEKKKKPAPREIETLHLLRDALHAEKGTVATPDG